MCVSNPIRSWHQELEDFGEFDREGAENIARKYIDETRRRKVHTTFHLSAEWRLSFSGSYVARMWQGLWVEDKLVAAADKQRTRARKKG